MHIRKKEIFIIGVLIVVAVIRFFFFTPQSPAYESAIGKEITFEGVVIDAPDVRLSNQHLVVTPEGEKTHILVITQREYEVAYGDLVHIEGILEEPENFITSSEKEFNYKRYLANRDIYYVISKADMGVISHGHGNRLKKALFDFRTRFMGHIERAIDPPESDLANGILLGVKGGFDPRMRDEFIATGTIHIVALSGYNVSIVAEGVMKTLGLVFSQAVSVVCGIAVIVLFILMTGASATAVRAGIMAVIMLIGRMTGRTYDALRTLVIAGLLMIAYDPRVITDISFQLSFLATFGVLCVTPKVIGWVKFIPMRFKLRELVATTIAATITVLPLLLYSTGILSLVSLPANILILPFISFTMLLCFIAGILGFLFFPLSFIFGFVSYLMLVYILSIIHFFAGLPFASLTIQSFPLSITIALYGLLALWVWKSR
ncbi:MAG: ComEC/Rec2 family competence protein [Patescibacteria group bacterium]